MAHAPVGADTRAAPDFLQSTLDALPVHVAVLDVDGTIVAVNRAWCTFAPMQPAGAAAFAVGANYLATCDAAAARGITIAGEIAAGTRKIIAGRLETLRSVYPRPDLGPGVWFQVRVTRFTQGDTVRLVVSREDVSQVEQAEQRLQHLAVRLLRSQDDERRRIARELHDTTAQNLFALTLLLAGAQQATDSSPADAQAALAESRRLAEQALGEVRTLSYLLHPPLLDEMGLGSAVQWYVEGFRRRSGIAVELQVPADLGRLPADVETALYRMLQESLINIHRHSGSASAVVKLTRTRQSIRLQVRDRGHGMPSAAVSAQHDTAQLGVGIAGLRQPLDDLGGRLDIRSSRRGTTVAATVPLTLESAT
jgi:signal transduction histidine kinase